MSRYYVKVIPVLLLFSQNTRLSAASPSPFPTPTASAPPSLPAGAFSADRISNFLRHRCGSTESNTSPALWLYEGTLTDPVTGKVVAEVEGLEVVKQLPTVEPAQLSNENNQAMWMEHLSAKELLYPPTSAMSSVPPWDAATTVLSRRLFCYRRPSSNPESDEHPAITSHSTAENKQFSPFKALLTSVRLRPDGPLRHLSLVENIAIYDSAITYVSRNRGREMVVFSERGGRGGGSADNDDGTDQHYVVGAAQSTASRKGGAFDFSVDARRGTRNMKSASGGPRLPPLQLPYGKGRGADEEVTISPPRSRFVQFGKGDGHGNAAERQHGSVREAYRYSFAHAAEGGGDAAASSSAAGRQEPGFFGSIKERIGRKTTGEEQAPSELPCSVGYTRHGEAPPWYAPGRPCTLELRGKRISLPPSIDMPEGKGGSVDHLALSQCLPALPAWAASHCDFWSGWPTVFSRRRRTADREDLVRRYYQLPPPSKTELARQAARLFRDEERRSMGALEEYPGAERRPWLSYAEKTASKMHSCLRRASQSLIVSE